MNDALPLYAIVELLIRAADHDSDIGNYKNHAEYNNGVLVKTSSGTLTIPKPLILKQFEKPEHVSEHDLKTVASSFKPL